MKSGWTFQAVPVFLLPPGNAAKRAYRRKTIFQAKHVHHAVDMFGAVDDVTARIDDAGMAPGTAGDICGNVSRRRQAMAASTRGLG